MNIKIFNVNGISIIIHNLFKNIILNYLIKTDKFYINYNY